MADRKPDFVFISYSSDRREVTAKLAADLEAAGYATWWDTDLVAGDSFRAEINKQLNACKAAIIIWTPESIESEWVLSEAGHALRLKKLINTHVPDLAIDDIPKPFDQRHSVGIDNRDAIIKAIEQRIMQTAAGIPVGKLGGKSGPGRKQAKQGTGKAAAKGGAMLGAQTLLGQTADPPAKPSSLRWPLLALAAVAALGAVAGWLLWGTPGEASPQWAFDNKPFFLGEDIPFAWTYEPQEPGTSVRFEIESAGGGAFKPVTACPDAHHYYVGNVNGTRSWRIRAIADCETRAPLSPWSAPIVVTQYDSVYERIDASGKGEIYVSNSQDQDVFKWGEQGFDIDLAKVVLRDLAARMNHEVKPVWQSVQWEKLLPAAGEGSADFSISSITKRPWREKTFNIQFSDPYFCTTHALIYRAGTQDGTVRDMLAGRKVGVQRETTNARLAEALAEGGVFELEKFDNTESLRNALLASKIDFALTDTSFAHSAQLDTRLGNGMNRLEFKELTGDDMPPSMQDQQTQEYAIAVRKGELQLLGAINETIAKAKQDGSLAALFKAASEKFEHANNYPPGSRSLGEHPWKCFSQTAGHE